MNPTTPIDHPDPNQRSELLSSLADGECDARMAEQACRHWKSTAQARVDWHLYHVIGDVLRSDELAGSAVGDAAFLRQLRGRLADEPVPLPSRQPLQVERTPPRRWLMPAAAVGAFAIVGVVAIGLRSQLGVDLPSGWPESSTVMSAADSGVTRRVVGAAPAASAQMLVIDRQVIRDARLDAYFEAHRGAVGPVSPALPGGALRSVEMLVPQR